MFSGSRYFLYALDVPPLEELRQWAPKGSLDLVVQATSNRDVEGSDCVTMRVPVDLNALQGVSPRRRFSLRVCARTWPGWDWTT